MTLKSFFDRYLNEIAGLTIMVLMAGALVAGQANADSRRAAIGDVRDAIEIRLGVPDPERVETENGDSYGFRPIGE